MIILGIIDQKSFDAKIAKNDALSRTEIIWDHFWVDTIRKNHSAMNSSSRSINLFLTASKDKILFMN